MHNNEQNSALVPSENIEAKIYLIRGKRVMLDRDLSSLYGVITKVLNQAVKRNMERFPEDFMFQLTKEEVDAWKSQIVTSNKEKKGLRKLPYVFTEQGVAMLSSVLNSRTAILVNIQIIRTFTRIKEAMANHRDILLKIETMEKRYDQQFQVVFKAIKLLLDSKPKDEDGHRRFGLS